HPKSELLRPTEWHQVLLLSAAQADPQVQESVALDHH
ncbi:hypothetical protein A2U01_0098204, partial [Trifolium medium]|nr:hypothetical protein [Trifolium medium]